MYSPISLLLNCNKHPSAPKYPSWLRKRAFSEPSDQKSMAYANNFIDIELTLKKFPTKTTCN